MAATATDLAARPASPLSKADAKKVTASIKRQLADVQGRSDQLIAAVRQARADAVWSPLGYASWDDYVRHEFADLSRGQKHRLSAWAEVVGELEAAAGGPVEVSGRQAARVRKQAPAVAEKVREHLAGKPDPTDEDRREAVAAALAEPIEATATKVEPPAEPEPDAEAAGDVAEAERFARARAAMQAPAPAPAPVETARTAGELLRALASIEPATAAETVDRSDLDALSAWIGLVRAAVSRRHAATPIGPNPSPSPAPAKAAAKKAAPVKAAAPVENAGAMAPKDCPHPPGRLLGMVCAQCGATVGKQNGRQDP